MAIKQKYLICLSRHEFTCYPNGLDDFSLFIKLSTLASKCRQYNDRLECLTNTHVLFLYNRIYVIGLTYLELLNVYCKKVYMTGKQSFAFNTS